MALVGLDWLNRLALLGWSGAVAAVALRAPALGPLGSLPPGRQRVLVLALVWLVGVLAILAWRRALWTAMADGADFRTEGGRGPLLGLPTLRATLRERTVTAEAVRPGRSPLARLRIEAAVERTDRTPTLDLSITTEADPDGRVLFEAPDADRRYVLHDGSGDLERLLSKDFKAELVDVETPGRLRVVDDHASYDLEGLPFDAASLRTCATTTVRLAEQAERAAGQHRG